MKKCKKNKPCDGCFELHGQGDPDQRGLIIADTVNIKTHVKGVRIGYRFPRGAEHKGLVCLNFCPWCGVDQSFSKKRKKK